MMSMRRWRTSSTRSRSDIDSSMALAMSAKAPSRMYAARASNSRSTATLGSTPWTSAAAPRSRPIGSVEPPCEGGMRQRSCWRRMRSMTSSASGCSETTASARSSRRPVADAMPASSIATAASRSRRTRSAGSGDSRLASSQDRAAVAGAPRRLVSLAASSRAWATVSSGPTAARARCQARAGEPFGSVAASARCAARRSARGAS